MKTFKEYIEKRVKECGVPFIGQAPDSGGEMSWQGAAGNGELHSAKGNIPVKKKHKKKPHH